MLTAVSRTFAQQDLGPADPRQKGGQAIGGNAPGVDPLLEDVSRNRFDLRSDALQFVRQPVDDRVEQRMERRQIVLDQRLVPAVHGRQTP